MMDVQVCTAAKFVTAKDAKLYVHQDRDGSVNDRTSTPRVLGSYSNEEELHGQIMK